MKNLNFRSPLSSNLFRNLRQIALIFVPAILLTACSGADTVVDTPSVSPTDISTPIPYDDPQLVLASKELAQIISDEGWPSASLAVAKKGEIVWSQTAGYASLEDKALTTLDTPYSLASISKTFTAIGILILVERGQIDLDAPINDYLGDAKLTAFVGNAEDATVRRVLNHTAGLPLHYHFYYVDEDRVRPPMEESIRLYGKIVTVPGETYFYSNFGYGLLDYIIERVSGKPYAAFIREEIFVPLGMENSFIPPADPYREEAAVRYNQYNEPYPFYDFDHPGGSAVFASANDLVSFGQFLIDASNDQSPLLSLDSYTTMTALPAEGESENGYGLGIKVSTVNDHLSISHGGGMDGVSTRLLVLPEEEVVSVVLLNTNSPEAGRVADLSLLPFVPSFAGYDQTSYAALETLSGTWTGHVRLNENGQKVPLKLIFKKDGFLRASLDEQELLFLSMKEARSGYHHIEFVGAQLPDTDAQQHPHRLVFTVKPDGSALRGSVSATSRIRAGERVGNSLAFVIQLQKEVN